MGISASMYYKWSLCKHGQPRHWRKTGQLGRYCGERRAPSWERAWPWGENKDSTYIVFWEFPEQALTVLTTHSVAVCQLHCVVRTLPTGSILCSWLPPITIAGGTFPSVLMMNQPANWLETAWDCQRAWANEMRRDSGKATARDAHTISTTMR